MLMQHAKNLSKCQNWGFADDNYFKTTISITKSHARTSQHSVTGWYVNLPFSADPVKALHFAILVYPIISIFDIRVLWRSGQRQSARMSKIKNGGLDQYGTERFEGQQFGTAGIEGVKLLVLVLCHNEQVSTSTPSQLNIPTTLTGTGFAHARPRARRPSAKTHGTRCWWHIWIIPLSASSNPPAPVTALHYSEWSMKA